MFSTTKPSPHTQASLLLSTENAISLAFCKLKLYPKSDCWCLCRSPLPCKLISTLVLTTSRTFILNTSRSLASVTGSDSLQACWQPPPPAHTDPSHLEPCQDLGAAPFWWSDHSKVTQKSPEYLQPARVDTYNPCAQETESQTHKARLDIRSQHMAGEEVTNV